MLDWLSDYDQTTVAGIIVILGTGVLGTIYGILRYGLTYSPDPDMRREFIFLMVKIFSVITVGGITAVLLFRYVL
jgi:hypothetical protein